MLWVVAVTATASPPLRHLLPTATKGESWHGREQSRRRHTTTCFAIVARRWPNRSVSRESINSTEHHEPQTQNQLHRGVAVSVSRRAGLHDGVADFVAVGRDQPHPSRRRGE